MRRSLCSIAVLIPLISVPGTKVSEAQAPAASIKPAMTAKLVDPEKKAAERGATVEVTVSGVQLTDPATADEKAAAGQAHLHYQVDKGPVIATTATKLSFHELTPGSHTIVVILAGNDHKPLGPRQQLTVNVPNEVKSSATGPGESHAPPAPTGVRVVP
jgi:hypothetical protein